MITAGIDVGTEMVRVVFWEDTGQTFAVHSALRGQDDAKVTNQTFAEALQKAKLRQDQVKRISATGVGSKKVPFATSQISVGAAGAKGATHLFSAARTIIDVGAEEVRAIKCDAQGKVLGVVVNERCAAGTGSFVRAMAVALEVTVEEMGDLSLSATDAPFLNAQCGVFAELEVVSFIHAGVSKTNIARAIHDSLASRISSMVRVIGAEPDVVLIGGLANNRGFVDCLKRDLKVNLLVSAQPDFVTALGAAVAGIA